MPNRAERWLLELMANRALSVLDATSVLVLLEDHAELTVAATAGKGGVSAKVMPIEGSALGRIYRRGQPLAMEHPLRDEGEFLRELGVEAQTALVQPLGIGPPGGMVIALRRDAGLRKGDESALGAVATSLTQHLMAERRAEAERLRYGAQAREHERERWAREIHDETVQGLGALRLQLANARDSGDPARMDAALNEVFSGLQREIEGLRHLITELRPAALDDLGLEAALQALARRADSVYGLAVEIDVAPELADDGSRLDAELETTVYRIVQEALSNVSRHAEASRAYVSVKEGDGVLIATVEDDGKGMVEKLPAAPGENGADSGGGEKAPGGFGLPGMRERAELVGGDLELYSTPGEGTTLRLSVPLAGRAEQAPGAHGGEEL